MKLPSLAWARRRRSSFQRAPDGSLSLVEHLLELRSRLFKATVAVAAGMVVGYLLAQTVFDYLAQPYCDLVQTPEAECSWNWLAPTDSFMLRIKIALWIGLVVAAPFWLYQLWAFIAPGLHQRERRWAYGFGALAIPLFAAGTALAYFVLDKGLKFLFSAGVTDDPQLLEPTRYISFVTTLILAFGLSFQFPVFLLLLNVSGIASARKLLAAWRVVVFLCFAFAAVFTPDPGPFGMILLALCLCLLYFLAVGAAFLNDRRRARRRDPLAELPDDQPSPLPDTPSPLDEELDPDVAGAGIDATLAQSVPEPRRSPGRSSESPAAGAPTDPRRYDDLI